MTSGRRSETSDGDSSPSSNEAEESDKASTLTPDECSVGSDLQPAIDCVKALLGDRDTLDVMSPLAHLDWATHIPPCHGGCKPPELLSLAA